MERERKSGNGHELKIVKDATCTFCGCVCDDIDLIVEENQIVEAKNACVLASITSNSYLYQANGQIGLFCSIRFGGGVIQSEAFKWGITA